MNFFYEIPWWLLAGIALLGLILFVTGNNRLEARLRYAGLAAIFLAILLGTASYFLDSDREIVLKRTRALVESVAQRDWPRMNGLLHPDVTVLRWRNRTDVLDGTKWAAERFDLKGIKIASLSAEQPNPNILVHLKCIGDFKDWSGSITDWKLEWEKTDQGWQLLEVEFLGSPFLTESQLNQQLGGRQP